MRQQRLAASSGCAGSKGSKGAAAARQPPPALRPGPVRLRRPQLAATVPIAARERPQGLLIWEGLLRPAPSASPAQRPAGRASRRSATMQSQQQRPRAGAPGAARGAAAAKIARPPRASAPGARRQRPSVAVANNWKVFGPTAEYSDGDAEFYRLTSQLSDQYEWFAPREPSQQPPAGPEDPEQQLTQQQRSARPEFGMSPREIAALGLSGARGNLPDPVRARSWSPAAPDRRLVLAACSATGQGEARPPQWARLWRAIWRGGRRSALTCCAAAALHRRSPPDNPTLLPQATRTHATLPSLARCHTF